MYTIHVHIHNTKNNSFTCKYTCTCTHEFPIISFSRPVKQEDTHCLYRNISMSSLSVKSLPLREYYVYDSRLILPEYLVTVTYDRGGEEGGRREGEGEGREKEEEKGEEERNKKKNDDSDLINSFPQPEGRPK